jgi:hypothetical protein
MARQKLRREDEQLVEGLESLADGVEHGQRHVHCTEPQEDQDGHIACGGAGYTPVADFKTHC